MCMDRESKHLQIAVFLYINFVSMNLFILAIWPRITQIRNKFVSAVSFLLLFLFVYGNIVEAAETYRLTVTLD